MSPIRKMATRLLVAIVQRSSGESRTWGNAMLREMDFVDNDWSAVRWALGSTSTLCRYSIAQQLRTLFYRSHRATHSLQVLSRKVPAMISGMVAASALLAACILLLSSLLHASWFDPALRKLADRLLFVVVPEALYLASAIALWRRRKAMAVGILATGVVLMAHALVHFVTHG